MYSYFTLFDSSLYKVNTITGEKSLESHKWHFYSSGHLKIFEKLSFFNCALSQNGGGGESEFKAIIGKATGSCGVCRETNAFSQYALTLTAFEIFHLFGFSKCRAL